MRLKDIQEYATYLTNKNGWGNEPLETRILYLKSEINEALVEVNNLLKEGCSEKREEIKRRLGHELFDVIWNVAELANRFGIDLEASAEQKMLINSNREFSSKPKEFLINNF